MSLNNRLTLAREHTIFAVPETTVGTLVFPSAGDLVVPAGYGSIGQVPTYTDSEEIVDSRSLLNQFRDALPAGDWSIPMYLRPSGTAGSVPQGATMLEALFGTETIVGSTSVTYSLATALPSFSLWTKYGDTVFFAKGATVEQTRLAASKKGAVKFEMSGKFMAMGWVGTDELNAAVDYVATPITSIVVKDAKKYCVGGKIKVGSDDNSGSGYAISAVTIATNTLTISPGLTADFAADTVVAPFLPTGTIIGDPVESNSITISLDGGSTTAKIKSFDITMTNGIVYQEDEISDEENPTAYVEGQRSVKGSVTVNMRRDDVKYFYDGLNAGQEVGVELVMGADAGSIATMTMDKCRLTLPQISPASPTVELRMDLAALGTSGEDEIKLVLT